jgi:hypothetical protein
MVEGLAQAVIEEANESSAARAIVVDTLGLTQSQILYLEQTIAQGVTTSQTVLFLKGR